jgi:hypothetical protein
MRLVKLFLVGTLFISGCAGERQLTWTYLLDKQTTEYVNENGQVAHSLWCHEPGNCYHMAGMLCPNGYVMSDVLTSEHSNWSFSANRWAAGGGSTTESITRFNIVCKYGEPRRAVTLYVDKSVTDNIEHTNPYDPLKDSRK